MDITTCVTPDGFFDLAFILMVASVGIGIAVASAFAGNNLRRQREQRLAKKRAELYKVQQAFIEANTWGPDLTKH